MKSDKCKMENQSNWDCILNCIVFEWINSCPISPTHRAKNKITSCRVYLCVMCAPQSILANGACITYIYNVYRNPFDLHLLDLSIFICGNCTFFGNIHEITISHKRNNNIAISVLFFFIRSSSLNRRCESDRMAYAQFNRNRNSPPDILLLQCCWHAAASANISGDKFKYK